MLRYPQPHSRMAVLRDHREHVQTLAQRLMLVLRSGRNPALEMARECRAFRWTRFRILGSMMQVLCCRLGS
jgi:hypothetical protein